MGWAGQDDIWHGRRCVSDFVPGVIGGYYIDLANKTHPYMGAKSPDGYPLVFLGSKRGYRLHPVTVCQVALGWDQQWRRTRSSEARVMFLGCADWLVANQQHEERGGVWPVPYSVRVYRLRAGWISGIVQGQALSVLARAFQITSDNRYLASAQEALSPFLREVHQGGLIAQMESGGVWYEEYPTSPKSCVLNGYISSLFGLYDFSLVCGSSEVSTMFWDGVSTLGRYLPVYDSGFWSRYSLFSHRFVSNLASPYYHVEHISQLRVVAKLSGQLVFESTAERWEQYRHRHANFMRVLCAKIPSRLYTKFSERKEGGD